MATLTAEGPALQDRVRSLVARDPGAEFGCVVSTYLTSRMPQPLGNFRRPDSPGRMLARRARRRPQAVGANTSTAA